MIRVFFKNDVHPWQQMLAWQKEHPYGSSFIIAFLFAIYMLFSSPAVESVLNTDNEFDPLSFVDIEMKAQKELSASKEISVDPNAAPDENNVQRATGIVDWKSAVDTDLVSNAAPPRPVGRLKNAYPKSGRDAGIEAVVYVELLIHTDGKVVSMIIHRIKLLKEVPAERQKILRKDFAIYAKKNLLGQQFTPFILNGVKTKARVTYPLRFTLPK